MSDSPIPRDVFSQRRRELMDNPGAIRSASGYSGTMLIRLTALERAEYFTLWKAQRAALVALDKWVEKRTMNAKAEIGRATQAVLDGKPA